MSSESYLGHNDLQIDEIKLTSALGEELFVHEVYMSCNIYEDMFSNTLSANLWINDTNNLIRYLPLVGDAGEKLTIKFSTPSLDEPKEYEFAIFKISDKLINESGKKQIYKINAISEEQIKNSQTKISKAFYGPIHEIVQDIFDDYIKVGNKELEIKEDTDSEKRKFIIPNLSPFQAINWLSKRAVPASNQKAANYLFYENSEKFVFTSIDKLLQEPNVIMDYLYLPRNYREFNENKPMSRDYTHEFRNVYKLNFIHPQDKLDDLNMGMYASKVLTHDIVKKEYKVEEYKYKDEFKQVKHTNDVGEETPYKLISDRSTLSDETDTVFMFVPKHENLHQENESHPAKDLGATIRDNDKFEKWILHRTSLMSQILSDRVTLEVAGDSRVKCGEVINLFMYAPEPVTESREAEEDKYVVGNYLITSIRHSVTPGGYTMMLECSKDCYGQQLASGTIDKIERKDQDEGAFI